jgi:hypothetical protein
MDRETALLVSVVMLSLAALTVGVSGWVLLARDRRLGRDRSAALASTEANADHHGVTEEA